MDVVSYILSKKYVEDSLAGAGALAGKSAYEIAQNNGFTGTVTEWLASLRGDTPEIGPNGTWVISGNDTGVIASPSLAGYATEEYVRAQIAAINLTPYATRKELNEAISKITIPDVSEFVTRKELLESIGNIKIPSIEGLATESFVELKCNEILNSIPTPPSYDEIIFDGGEIE